MEPPAAVDFFFLAVTWLGSLHLLLPAALAVAALPVAGSHRFEALLPGVSLGLGALLTHALKLLVRRPRPQVDQLLVTLPADWSFPSAHTFTCFLTLTKNRFAVNCCKINSSRPWTIG